MQDKPRGAAQTKSINRRRFLKTAGAAIVLPTILPGCVIGRVGRTPPSGKITMGVVGWGKQGSSDAGAFSSRTTAASSPSAMLTRII